MYKQIHVCNVYICVHVDACIFIIHIYTYMCVYIHAAIIVYAGASSNLVYMYIHIYV